MRIRLDSQLTGQIGTPRIVVLALVSGSHVLHLLYLIQAKGVDFFASGPRESCAVVLYCFCNIAKVL